MKTKVIVATYNGQTFKLLEKLVNSLNNVKSFGDYEILIVDNMSNDIEHNIYLESLNNKNISYIKNNTRGFDSGAYKYAIPQIINTADYYLFIQDDIEFCQDNWDKTFADVYENGQKQTPKVLFTAFCGQKLDYNAHHNQLEWIQKWLDTNDDLGDKNCFGPMWFIGNDNLITLMRSEYYQILHTRFFKIEHKGKHQEGLESGMASMAHRMGYTINWVVWRDYGGLGPDYVGIRHHSFGEYPLYHSMAKITTKRPNEY